MRNVADKLVGKIDHYYDKIDVAVVELKSAIKVGDTIKIKAPADSPRETDFTQEIVSMQVEHKQVKKAKKGDAIGLKVEQETKKGDLVYTVTS